MKHATIVAAVGLALAAALSTSPAVAQNARSFVSPTGNDSNSCTLNFPCRNFQPAYAKTNPGGEIAVLGTAGYGPLVIDHAISIVNAGGYEAAISVPAGGVGITINAGVGDAVVLRGLTINGGGVGLNGIVFNSGELLTIDNCVVQNLHLVAANNYSGIGIVIEPTSGATRFAITNTNASNNGRYGVAFFPPSGSADATGAIDHVVATANVNGLFVDTSSTSGAIASIAVSNSVMSNNGNAGLLVDGSSSVQVSVDNSVISGNSNGIQVLSTPNVSLGRSTIASNTSRSILNGSSTFYTYQNNQINLNGNGNAVGGTALTPVSFQ